MSFQSTPTLNSDDLNRILFDTTMDYQPSSSSTSQSCSSHALPYSNPNAAYFGSDNTFGSVYNGESIEDSEFLIACRLIVECRRAAVAAQLSMDQKQAVCPQEILQSLMGDVAPAAAAAIQSPLLDSPCLDTPYLDSSSMNTPYTPFTPATAFTPNLAAFQASPHFSPFIEGEGDFNNDISVANYLDGFKKQPSADLFKDLGLPQHTPHDHHQANAAATFNGDPSQLLLDKNKDWQPQEDVASAADSLFPPLAPDEAYDVKPSYDHLDHIDAFLENFDFNDAAHHDNSALDDMNHDDHRESSQQSSAKSSPYSDNYDDMPSNNNAGDDQDDDKNNKKRKALSQDDDDEEATSSEQDEKRAQPKRKRAKHPRRSTSGDAKKFECATCHQVFNRRYNLNTHEKTHDKARFKEFGCYVCEKRFDRKHDRDRHISTVHHGERLFACRDCESAFSRKDALTRHLVQKHGHDAIV